MARIQFWKSGMLGSAAARLDSALYDWAGADDEDWAGHLGGFTHPPLLRPQDLGARRSTRRSEPVPA